MEKLNFELPEFVRVVWASPEAREVWEGRIRQIANLWPKLERLAVADGIKPATLQVCTPEELPELTTWAIQKGLTCAVLGRQGVTEHYTNSTQPVVDGQPWAYRIIIAAPKLATAFIKLWESKNDDAIGAALGFPVCCRDFFAEYWVKRGWRDLTFPMCGDQNALHHKVAGSITCHVLLRWLGLRYVSHLPCGFGCSATEEIGKGMAFLAVRHGHVRELGWLDEILKWPVRWSSLHGAAIITTPVFRIVTNSTPVDVRITVDRDGPGYPTEGARGNDFPFRVQHAVSVRGTNDYTDNGFKSYEAMHDAHRFLLKIVKEQLSGVNNGKVIDLGCGNGKLLEDIWKQSPWVELAGVEVDESRHQKAARRLLPHDGNIHNCNIAEYYYWEGPYRLALVSLNRIEEMKLPVMLEFLKRLRDNCQAVIVYSYDCSKWPGCEGLPEFFNVEGHFSGDNTCAVLLRPKGTHDQNHVQG